MHNISIYIAYNISIFLRGSCHVIHRVTCITKWDLWLCINLLLFTIESATFKLRELCHLQHTSILAELGMLHNITLLPVVFSGQADVIDTVSVHGKHCIKLINWGKINLHPAASYSVITLL